MAICYDRLFHLMIDKKISNAQLKEKAGFSANIITRLKRNEYVSIESIEKICRVMECGVDDILELSLIHICYAFSERFLPLYSVPCFGA